VIATAIYELLNVTDVTDLVSGVYISNAPQNAAFPYIVFRERAIPEDTKIQTKIITYDVEIIIVSDKGRNGAGGFKEIDAIGAMVHSKLNRFAGLAGGKMLSRVVRTDIDTFVDPETYFAIHVLDYRVRESVTESLADPANYPITVNVYVNDVLQDSNVVNGYEDNTFTVS